MIPSSHLPQAAVCPLAAPLDVKLRGVGLFRDPRTGVGKLLGHLHYVHISCEDVLPIVALAAAKGLLPRGFCYVIIKHDRNNGSFTFLESPDWDTATEPSVGDSYQVKRDGSMYFRNASQRTQIYHHPWLFVRDTYQGFNVQASKQRSLDWRLLSDIDFSRIAYRDFWLRYIVPRLSGNAKDNTPTH